MWGCEGQSVNIAWSGGSTSGTCVEIGCGENNTVSMVNSCCTCLSMNGVSQYTAANYCSDLNLEGYTDWFLPSKDEFDLLISDTPLKDQINIAINNLGGNCFYDQLAICSDNDESYWTSSEFNSSFGWMWLGIVDGWQYGNKGQLHIVRPVRSF